MLEQGSAPHGLTIFLKAAHVVEADADSVLLEVPAGPGLERLSGDSAARREVEQVMADLLGRSHCTARTLCCARASACRPARDAPRITPERVRSERLARISRSDRTLQQAVERWDLEIAD
jgi:hypothetical protein